MLPRARLLLVLPLLLVLAPSTATRAQPVAPPLSEFIDIVRGYDATTIRRTFPAYNQGLFQTIYGSGDGIPLATEAQRSLFTDQFVTTPAGTVLDIGHVITGLEAATAPTLGSRLVARQTGCDMVAAVTWSGDIGQALHDFIAEGGADPNVYVDREASVEDLIGDLDGYTLGVLSAAAVAEGIPLDVARLLTIAYIDGFDPGPDAWTLDSDRVPAFIAVLAGDEAATLADVRPAIAREVTCFARALTVFGNTGVSAEAIEAHAPAFIDRFVAFLEAE